LNGDAFDGEIWRFLTAVFLHGGVGHILFNGFALLLFGSILERFVGGRRFLIVFFVTGILANLISVNFYSSSLGASGAIFGVIGALVIVRPGLTVWAFGMPMKACGCASFRHCFRFSTPMPGSTSTGTAPVLKMAKVSALLYLKL